MKEYTIKINGNEYAVSVKGGEDNMAHVCVNGTDYQVEVEGLKARKVSKVASAVVPTPAPGQVPTPVVKPQVKTTAGDIKSPLPGVVLEVMVREGDEVKVGQHLMLLEAMKMENNIDADRDGKVVAIRAGKGASVLEGDVLITIG
ncbi:MAG: biotin/lipoyl-containing protein [Mucinivorans sp.]